MNLLQNKRLVIIGGSSGIGLATAKLATTQGAEVIITGLQEESIFQAIKEIGDNTKGFVLDVNHENEIKAFFEKLEHFDYLAIPGSSTPKGDFLTMTSNIAREGFESKFWGQYFAAKYALPLIREGGSITFFSGIISQRPQKNLSIMAAVNSAVEGLGRALAIELAPLRINTIAPGIVNTPRYAGMNNADREAMFKQLAVKLPAGHVGTPEELAQAVIFLMTNTYMTGQTLFVDGGHYIS